MREPKLADSGWHECNNCGMIWHWDSLLDIQDYFQRVEAGGVVPSGECPACDCGALCYPSKPHAKKYRTRQGLGWGYCSEHGEFKMDSEETECPACDDQES